MSAHPPIPFTRTRDEAPLLHFAAMQLDVRVLVSTEESAGGQCVTEFAFAAPFGGPPPHWHRTYAETFVCLEGAFTLVCADHERVMHPGDVAYIPPGTLHTYRVDGHTPTRYVLVCTPGAQFEKYIAEAALHAAEAHRQHRPLDMEVLRDIRGRHETYEADVPRF